MQATSESTQRYFTQKRLLSHSLCLIIYVLIVRRGKRSKQRSGLRQVLCNALVGLSPETSTCRIRFQNDSKLNLFPIVVLKSYTFESTESV